MPVTSVGSLSLKTPHLSIINVTTQVRYLMSVIFVAGGLSQGTCLTRRRRRPFNSYSLPVT
jgi:hypothetical protein